MNGKIIKRIHYISLIAMILLIIPSGLNQFYFSIFFLVLGVNTINGGLGVYEESKKKHIIPLICGVIAIGFGIYRLIF
ncbi:hypothetical protein [Bacillus thuringiensis]|uniref:hypothetical protein n=1 Tax=Bacillus thuringiensis TaxID=1428 RepID=UPI000B436007|nr:hypothetical protein [Bacillus thuringiensis]MEB9469423.1 hypothetical protein [Bacillus cereus]MEC0032109.1 hypothetical protein [Bacillus cereus]OUA18900.1 hypothetical protein BK776_27665 [Bacillus thuringiensis serovar aizawai]PES54490.1 hypothetical protein CN506_20670 [Bacillus thuringiensis]